MPGGLNTDGQLGDGTVSPAATAPVTVPWPASPLPPFTATVTATAADQTATTGPVTFTP